MGSLRAPLFDQSVPKIRCYPAGYTGSKIESMNDCKRIRLTPRPFALDNFFPVPQREKLKPNEAFSLWYCVPMGEPEEFYLKNDLYNFVSHLGFEFPVTEKSKLNVFVIAPARLTLQNFTPTLRYYPSHNITPPVWKSKNGEPLQSFCAIDGSTSSFGLTFHKHLSILVNCHFKDEVSPRKITGYRFWAGVFAGITSAILAKILNTQGSDTVTIYVIVTPVVYVILWLYTGFHQSWIERLRSMFRGGLRKGHRQP